MNETHVTILAGDAQTFSLRNNQLAAIATAFGCHLRAAHKGRNVCEWTVEGRGYTVPEAQANTVRFHRFWTAPATPEGRAEQVLALAAVIGLTADDVDGYAGHHMHDNQAMHSAHCSLNDTMGIVRGMTTASAADLRGSDEVWRRFLAETARKVFEAHTAMTVTQRQFAELARDMIEAGHAVAREF